MLKISETTFVSKIGTTRAGERTRVWIEGKRLIAAKFLPGDHFKKTWDKNSLQLEKISLSVFEKLSPLDGGLVSGKGDKPIIDIAGQKVFHTFGHKTHVNVAYQNNKILIRSIE